MLLTRLSVRDGRFVLPDGMSYRVLWIPEGTHLLPESARKIAELESAGGRVVRGNLVPDWPSPLEKLGFEPRYWYQRREGKTDVFFAAETNGVSRFVSVTDGVRCCRDALEPKGFSTWKTLSSVDKEQTFEWHRADGAVWLDLGDVRYWAVVRVNGNEAARMWSRPYRCEITPFLKEGENVLNVEVTSTIYNRLVEDARLPESQRTTWTIAGPTSKSTLRPAGVLGPVRLLHELR